MTAPRHYILSRRNVRCLLLGAALLCILLVTGFAYYYQRQLEQAQFPPPETRTLLRTGEQLRAENLALIRNQQESAARIMALEQGRKVDQAAIQELQKDLQSVGPELRKLRREIAFYEGIMDAAGGDSSLNIQGLLLAPMNTGRYYRYKLVLTNMTKSDKLAEGKVEMLLQGTQEGKSRTLSIEQLQLDTPPDPLQFKFKRFKQFKGNLALPEAFTPVNVKVRVQVKGQKAPVERDFDWPTIEEKR